MRLRDKVALITGGTSGIGRATALLFAREGARVAITGRNRERGKDVETELGKLGSQGLFIPADVRLDAECRRAVESTVAAFGRLDVLFNNAGVYVANDAVDCSEAEFDSQVDTSLKGSFLMSRHALPHMIRGGGGAIVNNSSGWGYTGGARSPTARPRAA
jgi:NAD(P)-dependent dehydrogenase (short-subunit alcohol dehydrogenase family)